MSKVVFTQWTIGDKPWVANWRSERDNLLGWVAAVHSVQDKFESIELVTDTEGATVLVEDLKLPFTSVNVALDGLDADPIIWPAGKITAYKEQDEPFVHLDSDVILFKPLPDWFLSAPIGVQNIEQGDWFERCYRPFIDMAERSEKFWKPDVWGKTDHAHCMAVFSANDIDFVKCYAKYAMDLIVRNDWQTMPEKHWYAIIAEQWMMSCTAKDQGVSVVPLSPTFDRSEYNEMGYCHLWGAKRNDTALNHLRNYVANIDTEWLGITSILSEKIKG